MNVKFIVNPVIYGILLFSLFMSSCCSTRRKASQAPNYAADVAGEYYGSGKLWSSGDIKDVAITLTNVDSETVNATIRAVLPTALRALGGKKTMTGALTVSPDYTLTGKVKLMIFNFDATGSVDPSTHTIALHIPGNVMGHPLNFELAGGPGEPEPSEPDFATDVAGTYYGAGSMTGDLSGDVTDAEMILTYVDNTIVAAFIEAVLPEALQQAGGLQNMKGNLTVSPEYELTGTMRLLNHDLAVTGSVDPTNQTISLTLVGNVAGHALKFQLK